MATGLVGCAHGTKAGRLGLIPGRALLKTWKMVLALSSLVLSINGWVQGNSACMVLSLTCHQCSIYYESSCVPTVQPSRNGCCRPFLTLRKEHRKWG